MIAFAALAILTAGQRQATDYFPMEPGMKWTYETSGASYGLYVQEVGAAVEVEGKMRLPLTIKIGGKLVQTTFYDATPTAIFVLGHDPKQLLPKPQPVFQFDAKGAKWEFEGPSPYEDDKESRIFIKGQSKDIGQRTVGSEKRDCIEVKSETKIGLNEKTATVFRQTAIYAKGIGLVELVEIIQAGKDTQQRKVKLLKMESLKAADL